MGERGQKVFWSGFFGIGLIAPHIYLFLLPFGRWDRSETARGMVFSSIMNMILFFLGVFLLSLSGNYFEVVRDWLTWITWERKIIWIESVVIVLLLGTMIHDYHSRRWSKW